MGRENHYYVWSISSLMKKPRLLIPFILFSSVCLTAWADGFKPDSLIYISVSGVDHDIEKEGIRPVEFGELSMGSKDDDMQTEAFQITLAHGNRAVDVSDVRGNTFNLKKYASAARAGDSIVIEVKSATNKNDSLSPGAVIVVLAVK
jgi:hypothetical protein